MTGDTAQAAKAGRHRTIRSLINERDIRTQQELVRELQARGYDATQATVSRDAQALGLRKERDSSGRHRYVLPERNPYPEGACARMLQEFSREILAAGNLVLVKSDPGSAPGLGKALDDLDHPLMLGCVAGDDIVLAVTADLEAARAFAHYLQKLGG